MMMTVVVVYAVYNLTVVVGYAVYSLTVIVCSDLWYRARNSDRYSCQCDQNGLAGNRKFSSSPQIGDKFKINNIVKDVGSIRLQHWNLW